MTTTQLEQLVHEVVTASMRQRIARDVDSATETLTAWNAAAYAATQDLIRDEEFRERMRHLLRLAFDRAIANLSKEISPDQ